MTKAQKKAISKRMKEYWAKRNKFKVGKTIWATKNFYMNSGEIALKKGKPYEIVEERGNQIATTSEVTDKHFWDKEDILKHFSLVTPKKLPVKRKEVRRKAEKNVCPSGYPLSRKPELPSLNVPKATDAVTVLCGTFELARGVTSKDVDDLLARYKGREPVKKGLSFDDWILGVVLALSGAFVLLAILGANPFYYLIVALSFGYTGYFFGTRN